MNDICVYINFEICVIVIHVEHMYMYVLMYTFYRTSQVIPQPSWFPIENICSDARGTWELMVSITYEETIFLNLIATFVWISTSRLLDTTIWIAIDV